MWYIINTKNRPIHFYEEHIFQEHVSSATHKTMESPIQQEKSLFSLLTCIYVYYKIKTEEKCKADIYTGILI